MESAGVALGWWLPAGVVVAQVAAEPLRGWVERNLAAGRTDRLASAELRRRLRARPAEADRDVLQVGAGDLRLRARRARRKAALGWAVLAAAWLGAQAAVLHWQVNDAWLPWLERGPFVLAAAGAAVACWLGLWWALGRAGATAAFDRAFAQVTYAGAAGLAAALTFALVLDTPLTPSTAAAALLITLSPLVRRIIVTVARPRRAALPPEVEEVLTRTAPPPAVATAGPTREMPVPGRGEARADTAAHPHDETPAKRTPPPRRGGGPAPGDPRTPARQLDVVALAELTVGASLQRGRQYIRHATVPGSDEKVVFKRFAEPGAKERNPARPLAPYRRLLSRAGTLSMAERALLDRVALWPHAVVAENGQAVGVLYRMITPPFLLASGGAQTGDYLHADDPAHSGCQVVSATQRGQVLLDVLRAHEMLHDLGLAHGDTCWKNFVYGVQGGRGRGQLIDIDGVTAVDDAKPLLLHQPDWDVGGTPIERDRRRLALLVARLATPEIRYDSWSIPVEGVSWFDPSISWLAGEALSDPKKGTTARLRAALEDSLAGA
ncbi:hypothetical protein Misp01_43230 [Microtetraspora sp. NBRC 13810]|uniref:hypothetical protein n=1 Tax=Microtetraspora sp. NBRC 13810 TaxID=3030990 RepID=UPI0024A57BE9|nr:hypothetical protein [Microtetraspora sp. NBRC 13810]GLW09194.1 hypothetical protein Misp01_43230 [Microtetraspora sp. NBRC 13810]